MHPVSSTPWGVLRRSVLLPVGAFLLLSIAGLSSSSEADEPLFARSVQQFERLWSSVLGCTYPGNDEPRSTFETTLDDDNASSAIGHDYVECGKRALRNTSSRMLVDTIEDTLRQGGVALFDERFRLSSGIGWVWGENITGEFDALIPLLDNEHLDGTGQALFLQPGAIFWPGIEGEDRIDANFGLVYRRHFTPDTIVGGSAFYDYDFKQGSQRLGLGMDMQSGILHTALNYYHPLDDWQEGRTNYMEQPLQGADFRLGVAWSHFQLDTSLGIWRFEGEEEESTKWLPAFGVEAGYQILPGVFLQGGYEQHDSDDSLDSRWNAGLSFRFSLPGFEGSEGGNGRVVQPNLWELFEREKRVLYEERPIIKVDVSLESTTIREPGDSGNIPTTTKIIGVISGRELREDETIEVVVYDSTTAEYGQASDNDFTFSQGVYGVNTQIDGQVRLTGSAACTASPCRMNTPANSRAKSIEVEVSALDDSVEKEIPEFIDIRIDIRDGSGKLVHSSDVTRVTIQGHGNTVAFSSDTGSISEENETSFNITLHIDQPLPAGTDASVTLERSGTATDDDYMLSPASGNNGTLIDDVWSLPTETETATLQITAVDDSDNNDSGPERATFKLIHLTGAAGWSLGSATVQHVDITDETGETVSPATSPRTESAFIWSDIRTPSGDFGDTIRILTTNTVKFISADSTVAEEGDTVTISGELEALPEDVLFQLAIEGSTASLTDGDYTYGYRVYELDEETGEQSVPASAANCSGATCEMTVPAGVTRFDVEIEILADSDAKEIREIIVLQVNAPKEIRNIIRGNETTVTIQAHGNTVGFDMANSADEFVENGGPVEVIVEIDEPSPTPFQLTLTPGGGEASLNTDYTISRTTLAIPANAPSASLTLTGINNERPEGDKTITLTLSGNLPMGWSFPADISTHEITLRDEDLAVGFTSSNTARVEESVGNVVLSVASNQPLTGPAEIAWSVTAGNDELTSATSKSGTLNFATGDAEADTETITLAVMDDNNAEDAEEVTVTLTATTLPEGWSLGRNPHTFTIDPSDGVITFTETASITDSEGETVSIGITSTADGPRGGYPLAISIPDGLNGSNDITFPATVTLPEGQKTQNFSITIRRDNTPEHEETFTMSLSSGASAPADWTASASRTITIPANDNTVTFGQPSSATIASGESATVAASINLAIPAGTPSSQRSITIVPGGDAVNDSDYELSVSSALHGNLVDNVNNTWTWTLPEGADSGGNTRDVELTITAMETSRRNLTLGFGGALLPGWNATPASRSITLTPAGDVRTIGFASAASTVREGGTATLGLEFTDYTIPSGGVQLQFAVSGTAVLTGSSPDATYDSGTIIPNTLPVPLVAANNANPSFSIDIAADTTRFEEDETLVFTLRDDLLPSGVTPGRITAHTITIPANGNIAYFDSNKGQHQATVNEADAGTAILTVSLFDAIAPADGLPLELDITSGNDDTLVTFNQDRTPNNTSTFTVAAGQKSHEVTVYIVNNNTDATDNDQQVVFTLSAGSGFPSGWGRVGAESETFTLTVVDDDDPATVEWATTNVSYRPVGPGSGTFTASITPTMGASLSFLQVYLEISTVLGSVDLVGGPFVQLFGPNPRRTLTFTVTDSARGTITIMEDGMNPLPSGWELDNTVLNFAPEVSGPTIGFERPSFSVNEPADSNGSVSVTVDMRVLNYSITGPLMFDVSGTTGPDDASYNNNNLPDRLAVSFAEGVTSFDINIKHDGTTPAEPDETIILTLTKDNLPDGVEVGDIAEHTITILANGVGNRVYFAPEHRSGMFTEDPNYLTPYELFITLDEAAPEGGLPLRLTLTGVEGRAFENPFSGAQFSFPHDFRIPSGRSGWPLRFYVTNDDIVNSHNVATFTLTEQPGFPGGWGSVDTTSGANIHTLTIIDDEAPTTSPSPPR